MTLHSAKSTVGVRELHDQLSRYVQHVADGHEVVVTMRGRPIAKLSPLDAADPLEDLRKRGLVQEPTGTWSPRQDRPKAIGSVADIVVEQRR